jgi:endonuclease/exonuclease/phosphatase family metal-dependent hydrolase
MNLKLFLAKFGFLGLFFSPLAHSGEFRFMTYNAAFLPFVSTKFLDRKSHFAEEVARQHPDIIALQEVWMPATRNALIRDFKKLGYPYASWVKSGSFFPRGVIGHGLLVISKFPPEGDTKFQAFSHYTRPEEFLARKGVMKVPLLVPGLGRLLVFDLHLGAVTFSESLGNNPRNLRGLSLQLLEAIEFIKAEQEEGVPFILSGDFNLNPTIWDSAQQAYSKTVFCEPYHDLREILGAQEVFPMAAAENPETWVTWDPPNNPIIRKLLDPASQKNDPPSRFDYIWYPQESVLRLLATQVVMNNQNGKIVSDHYGLESTFTFPDQ